MPVSVSTRLPVMGLTLLLLLLGLAVRWPGVGGCLQCDRGVQRLHSAFLESWPMTEQAALARVIAYGLSRPTVGAVIDASTLYRAATEYQTEFQRFLDASYPDKEIQFQLIQVVEKGRRILERHLTLFIQTGLCPNKCGVLYQRVLDCKSCRSVVLSCVSSTAKDSCGVFSVQVVQGGQTVLDCFLPWHPLADGKNEYQYSWAPTLTPESDSDFSVLLVTPDSRLMLSQVGVADGGAYRCLLLSSNSTVLSKTLFLLQVTPLPITSPRPVQTVPQLPPEDPPLPSLPPPPPSTSSGPVLKVCIAAVTAAGMAGCMGVLVAFGFCLKREKRSSQQNDRERIGEVMEML
ncbi:izumo sperm-egg fusion protein 1 [Amia ocellicauda]|uniref:izumo sperm-egg fusion protein 1 n=1 Tax=Amia ocellicauda TaxID=2972642 RepID=UPI003463C7F0